MDKKYKMIDYYADYCQPCKLMKPVLEKISTESRFSDVDFEFRNVQEYMEDAVKLGIKSVPTLVILDDKDNVLGVSSGFKDETGIISFLNESLDKEDKKE